jgi:cytochrome c peroxidase
MTRTFIPFLLKQKNMKIRFNQIALMITVSLAGFGQNAMAEITPLSLADTKKLTLEQQLGKKIFFDTNLSTPVGMACATCHDVKTSFTDPIKNSPVSLGVVEGKTGSRNTPSAAYSAFAPNFHFDQGEGLYIGGQFLDGRAANLKEQAKGPFLNADEMNNADEQSVINKIKVSDYATLFTQVFGNDIFNNTTDAYDSMAQAIASFENTASFNRFSSKYDYYLAGRVTLTVQEQKGLALFEDEDKGNCAACHISNTTDGSQPIFTDFTYDNLGTPSNPEILALKGADFVDVGLGETVGSAENGKFKVTSLRNVAKTGPYMHNGVFTSLTEVVDFYNTRDVDTKWAAPEVAENVNTDELGDLQLTDEEVDAIVAFMRTLTDGYELQEKVTFSAEKSSIKLPYVRVEGKNIPDTFYSVTLSPASNGLFTVSQLNEISMTDYSLVESMPYYSIDTGLLELPTITKGSDSYTGELKSTPANKSLFSLEYVKKLQ